MTRYDGWMSSRLAVMAIASCFAACGNATPSSRAPALVPAPSASAGATASPPEPADGVVPKLRTGALAPVDDPAVLEPQVAGRYVGDGYETLVARLADAATPAEPATVAIDFPPGQPTPFAFVQSHEVWIRRVATSDTTPISGAIFQSADEHRAAPGRALHFRVVGASAHPSDVKVRRAWLRALAQQLVTTTETPWGRFSAGRLRALADALDPAAKRQQARPLVRPRLASGPSGDLATLMETTTGVMAVQEALQSDRPLFALAAREAPSIPIKALEGPALAHHPWKTMLARVGAPPAELLASSTPADFYYARASDLPSLFRLLDQVDAWMMPVASLLDCACEEREVASRYEVELALKRGPLTRALGPAVVGQVVVVGSDPYVREGSDVTVLLQAKSRPLLDAALESTLAGLEKDHGSVARSKRQHGAVEVSVARSADGAVTQQRASVGDLEIISNSAGAIDVVLDTCRGLHPKLADELDFQYMLARDSGVRADVLGYMSDRFVEAVVGPKQKVLEARRQIALGELTAPGFAALLYGWMQGKSPARVEDLLSASLLSKEEMKHASGAPISWSPGAAAVSLWGTPRALTPLIDLPVPLTVTPSERAGYERFARSYQQDWAAYIDPIALRIGFDAKGTRQTMTVDLRELPLIEGTKYREITDFVGSARFTPPASVGGARLILGIGADTWPRRELGNTLRGLSLHQVKFEWIGPWASVGLADRSVLASALLRLDPSAVPQMPEERPGRDVNWFGDDAVSTIATLPLYAQISVKGIAQVALALAALRVVANETIPGMFEWGEVARHRDVPIVRIALKKELARGLVRSAPEIDIFYAVTANAITITLQEWLLRRLVDESLDGKGPSEAADSLGAAQVSSSLGSEPGNGLWTALAWLIEGRTLEQTGSSSAGHAAALLFGAPEMAGDASAMRALAQKYLGTSPVTPDGAAYVLAKDGVRDPARGTPYAPVWPDAPVAGSRLAKVMQSLAAVRTEMGFDDEGKDGDKPMRSLHAKAVFEVR